MRRFDLGRTIPAWVVAVVLWLGVSALAAWGYAEQASSTATADVPLRLPADIVYDRTVGPDSAVVFSHQTHFGFAGNRCTGCHPKPFRMLTPTHRAGHAEMNSGGSCGTCHDGKTSFGVQEAEACATCHSGRPSRQTAVQDTSKTAGPSVARKLPKARAYPRSESSPGQVTFRHETHMKGSVSCASCHPKPFAMKVTPRPSSDFHLAAACGKCHDGSASFGVEDFEACARCHVETGAAR
jgi:c(7)-type cytochrome triheme protein